MIKFEEEIWKSNNKKSYNYKIFSWKLILAGDCSYLVRPSEQSLGDFTLFFNANNVVHRFRITGAPPLFHIGGRQFSSIVSIVDRYMSEEICEGGYRLSKQPHKRSPDHSMRSLLNLLGLIKQQTLASCLVNENKPMTGLVTTTHLNGDYLSVLNNNNNNNGNISSGGEKSKLIKSISTPLNGSISVATITQNISSPAMANKLAHVEIKATNGEKKSSLVHSKSSATKNNFNNFMLRKSTNNSITTKQNQSLDSIAIKGYLNRYSKLYN